MREIKSVIEFFQRFYYSVKIRQSFLFNQFEITFIQTFIPKETLNLMDKTMEKDIQTSIRIYQIRFVYFVFERSERDIPERNVVLNCFLKNILINRFLFLFNFVIVQ